MIMEGLLKAAELFFTPYTFFFLLLGVIIGLTFGFIPGLGGATVLVVLLPFTLVLDAVPAIAFILGAHAVVVTGDTLSAVLFNVPGTPQAIATCFDGFPLAQKGRAAEAIAAGCTSSMIGGVFGAVILMATIPIFKPLVMTLGSSEYFVMILVGVVMISYLGGKSILKGLVSGGLGFLCSFIGYDIVTGAMRFSFGSRYLYSGLNFVPVVIGLFAISQMLVLYIEGGQIARKAAHLQGFKGILTGIRVAFKHFKTLIRGSVIGAGIGMIPGLGGTVANLMAYGVEVASAKEEERGEYGKGKIEGVIAPESANNAKEGGALIPTLAFGIPGSSGMAILMSILLLKGIVPGPEMITQNMDITISFVLILVFANILSALLAMAATPLIEKVTVLDAGKLVPIIFVVCCLGAYADGCRLANIILAMVFGLIGFFMKKYNFSTTTFVIGMVLGPNLERTLHVSLRSWGPLFFIERPISLALLIVLVLFVSWPYLKRIIRSRKNVQPA